MSAYQCYVTKHAKAIQKRGGLKYNDALKKCREKWNGLTDEEKDPYVALAQEDA